MIANVLPVLSVLLERRYREQRRSYLAEAGFPWPERRSRKRRPIPGVLDFVDETEG